VLTGVDAVPWRTKNTFIFWMDPRSSDPKTSHRTGSRMTGRDTEQILTASTARTVCLIYVTVPYQVETDAGIFWRMMSGEEGGLTRLHRCFGANNVTTVRVEIFNMYTL
jgi:hypothetical protein